MPAQANREGGAHVRQAHLRQGRAVDELDQRMDQALRVHQHFDALTGHAEQVVGLDDFQALFINVAESTEIFGPIDHFGWATAWAG